MKYKVVQTGEFVDEILKSDCTKKAINCGTVYYVVCMYNITHVWGQSRLMNSKLN